MTRVQRKPRGLGIHDRRGARVDASEAARAELPSAPCFRCGARGWCEHRAPDGVVV